MERGGENYIVYATTPTKSSEYEIKDTLRAFLADLWRRLSLSFLTKLIFIRPVCSRCVLLPTWDSATWPTSHQHLICGTFIGGEGEGSLKLEQMYLGVVLGRRTNETCSCAKWNVCAPLAVVGWEVLNESSDLVAQSHRALTSVLCRSKRHRFYSIYSLSFIPIHFHLPI